MSAVLAALAGGIAGGLIALTIATVRFELDRYRWRPLGRDRGGYQPETGPDNPKPPQGGAPTSPRPPV